MQESSCGAEKSIINRVGQSIDKPNCSLCLMVWIAYGTGTALIEKVTRGRKSKTIFIF